MNDTASSSAPEPVIPVHSHPTQSPPPRGTRPWWNWKSILLCATIVGFYLAFRPHHVQAKVDSAALDTLPVAVVKVAREDLAREQVFDAEFRPYEEIELYAKASGFVEKISVDVGDTVKLGQCIATIEVPELKDDLEHGVAVEKRSREEVKKSEAAYEDTHVAFARLAATDKAQPHLIAQQELDQALTKDRGAEAALSAAREQVHVAEADVKKLKTMLSYCQITVPFDGVITKRFIDPGALIHTGGSAGTPIVRLSQNNRLRLVFPVSVSYVSLIEIAQPVKVRVQSLNKTFNGVVSRFTHKVDTATRTMDVEVEVPNADLKLIPGMYASVSIITEQRKNALVVPVEAVSRQKTSTVFLINKDQTIEERAVTLGLETAGELEVVTGLAEGELVMIGSRTQVHAGQKVSARMVKINSSENL